MRGSLAVVALACACAANAQPLPIQTASREDLADMTLEELSRIQVTSVSRRSESVSEAAASIYVITADDIRRSGVTTLPEALRLAPNLLVARMDAGMYAISARGFNNNIANKLLVLVDGRTIYSPLFSGTFWESHDVMLEDVERIEVVSGAGGTAWGANAMNGVINVITRSSKDTRGTYAALQAGNHENVVTARHGASLFGAGSFRIYGKAWQTDGMTTLAGIGAADGWKRSQGGFRTDWGAGTDTLTFQGDVYDGRSEPRAAFNAGAVDVGGWNLLARWTHRHDYGAETQVQTYFDRNRHRDRLLLDENGDVWDIEARHLFALGAHRLQFGAGYRRARDASDPGTLSIFMPQQRTLNWTSLFAQGQFRVLENVEATLGVRFEENDYTGWETLPTARLGWKVTPRHFLWGAVSRAVRAPSRLDREIFFPSAPPFIVAGGPNFDSEIADVFELGYRAQPSRAFSYSLTLFRQDYEKLKSAELTNGALPFVAENRAQGAVEGLEAWAYWQVSSNWRLSGGLTTLDARLTVEPGSADPSRGGNLGNNPDYQWMLRSAHNIAARTELDIGVRRVASLPPFPGNAMPVPSYTSVDLRLARDITRELQLALVVQNAFDPFHREWGDTTVSAEIARIVALRAAWRL